MLKLLINKIIGKVNIFSGVTDSHDVPETALDITRRYLEKLDNSHVLEISYIDCEELRVDALFDDLTALCEYIGFLTGAGNREVLSSIEPVPIQIAERHVYVYICGDPNRVSNNKPVAYNIEWLCRLLTSLIEMIEESTLPESNFKRYLRPINVDLVQIDEVVSHFGGYDA